MHCTILLRDAILFYTSSELTGQAEGEGERRREPGGEGEKTKNMKAVGTCQLKLIQLIRCSNLFNGALSPPSLFVRVLIVCPVSMLVKHTSRTKDLFLPHPSSQYTFHTVSFFPLAPFIAPHCISPFLRVTRSADFDSCCTAVFTSSLLK